MSPVIFNSLVLCKKKVKHSPFRSECFSLGMVILEAGLLQSIQSVYDVQGKVFDVERLLDLINDFMSVYEENFVLKEMMLSLLDLDDKTRRDPQQQLELFGGLMEQAGQSEEVQTHRSSSVQQNDEFYELESQVREDQEIQERQKFEEIQHQNEEYQVESGQEMGQTNDGFQYNQSEQITGQNNDELFQMIQLEQELQYDRDFFENEIKNFKPEIDVNFDQPQNNNNIVKPLVQVITPQFQQLIFQQQGVQ